MLNEATTSFLSNSWTFVLNSANCPTELDLFQIKKKEEAVGLKWTKTTLLSPQRWGFDTGKTMNPSERAGSKASIAFVSNAA
jgi:hypothetical protein